LPNRAGPNVHDDWWPGPRPIAGGSDWDIEPWVGAPDRAEDQYPCKWRRKVGGWPRPTPLGRPGRRVSNARRQQKDYSPEAPGSFLNDFSTASRNNIGSRSPPLANSIIRLATMLTAGSVRSIKPKECKVSSNAEVMTATSSDENASSPKRDRIGMPATPPAKPRCLLPHLAGGHLDSFRRSDVRSLGGKSTLVT
jgi:hypothetical protein